MVMSIFPSTTTIAEVDWRKDLRIRKHASFALTRTNALVFSPNKSHLQRFGFLIRTSSNSMMIDLDSWYDIMLSHHFNAAVHRFPSSRPSPLRGPRPLPIAFSTCWIPTELARCRGEMGGGKLTLWNFHWFMYFMLKACGFHWVSRATCFLAWGVAGYVNDTSAPSTIPCQLLGSWLDQIFYCETAGRCCWRKIWHLG